MMFLDCPACLDQEGARLRWPRPSPTPRRAGGLTGLVDVFGSFLRILALSDHEGVPGGHGHSAS
jgi:hypothetical protein